MSDWEKLEETSLPEKEDFYSHLNMADSADAEYTHSKRVCKGLKKFRKISDLYVQNDTLLLGEIFNKL